MSIELFIDHLSDTNVKTEYSAGTVSERNGRFIIGYAMKGAENTFSIGQPVFDAQNNLMGYLGVGLYDNLNYAAETRIPCYYWEICLATKYCEPGKAVYTYFQNLKMMEDNEHREN